MAEELSIRNAIFSFAPRRPLQAALFLTYAFDGRWFEEAILPELLEREVTTLLVVRDGNVIGSEAGSARYRRANAGHSRVFHPKLALLVAEDAARAVIGSANLTRGSFERQLELASVFDLSRDERENHALFRDLARYLAEGVAKEVRGRAAGDLRATVQALEDVLERCPGPRRAGKHRLLHSYDDAIWPQLLERTQLRTIDEAIVVSPFYDASGSERSDDPAAEADDHGVFAALFECIAPARRRAEPPIRVHFRCRQQYTRLPVAKLRRHLGKLALYAQSDTAERGLHAKLLLLRGVSARTSETLAVALHGSPNFTSAALLRKVPRGNSELGVLTTLPPDTTSIQRCISVLGLEQGFYQVNDPAGLKQSTGESPLPRPLAGCSSWDATYDVATGMLCLVPSTALARGHRVRVLGANDAVLGEATVDGALEVRVSLRGFAGVDDRTQLHEISATTLLLQVLDPSGAVVRSERVAVNVERPQDFCGLTHVGEGLLTLDERIARAGTSRPPTYREQLAWLEARKTASGSGAVGAPTSHQADLDRFYRNVHQGLRGIELHTVAARSSAFTFERNLDRLVRWADEAARSDGVALSLECRLFLVARLVRTLQALIERCSPSVTERLPAMGPKLGVGESLGRVAEWLDGLLASDAARVHRTYVVDLQRDLALLQRRFPRGVAS